MKLLFNTLIILLILFTVYTFYKNYQSTNLQKIDKNITNNLAKHDNTDINKDRNFTKNSESIASIINRLYNRLQKILKQKVSKDSEQDKLIKANLNRRLKELNAQFGNSVHIRVFKQERLLELWIKPKKSKRYKLLKLYKICKYSGKLGPKLKEGDYQAPEGFYKVYKSSLNPNSSYYLSFNLGFPNLYDKAHNRTGSYLMVHGECVSSGCYAMGNKNIEEIYKLVKEALYNNQKFVQVDIFPFRLSKKSLKKYKNHKWYSFWKELQDGYLYFNKYKIVPKIEVKNRRYKLIN